MDSDLHIYLVGIKIVRYLPSYGVNLRLKLPVLIRSSVNQPLRARHHADCLSSLPWFRFFILHFLGFKACDTL